MSAPHIVFVICMIMVAAGIILCVPYLLAWVFRANLKPTQPWAERGLWLFVLGFAGMWLPIIYARL